MPNFILFKYIEHIVVTKYEAVSKWGCFAANEFGVEMNTFKVAKTRHRHVILNVTDLAYTGNNFHESVIASRFLLWKVKLSSLYFSKQFTISILEL